MAKDITYDWSYGKKLTPATTIRFGTTMIATGAGLAAGGLVGGAVGMYVGDQVARKGLSKLFKPKKK